MRPTNPLVAILPINLGAAAAFDQNDFPLEYYAQGGDLQKGSFLIKATLEEMKSFRQLGIDLNENQGFIFDTRLNIEALKAEKEKIQANSKTLNPFKALRNYRAARLFHAATRTLYSQTISTSEKIQRDSRSKLPQVVSGTDVQLVDDAVSPDAAIVGFSIELPDGLSDIARQTLNDVTQMIARVRDPFEDNSLISQIRDGEQAITLANTESLLTQDECVSGVDEDNRTSAAFSDPQLSRPTSPQTITHIHYNIIHNSIVTTGSSNLNGVTHNQGDRNSGASVVQQFAP